MSKAWKANWLTDEPFGELAKLHPFHKEMSPVSAMTHREDLLHHHWLVRGVFRIEEAELASGLASGPIVLDISADDYYKLYINGHFVAQGPAQSEADHYYYNRLEVGEFLQPGPNVIAVHVYYQGLLNRAWNSADYRQGLIAELTAGGRMIAVSDGTWKARRAEDNQPGDIFGYDTQFTEHIDARKTERGWRELDFDDSSWSEAHVSKQTDYVFIEQPTPALTVYHKLPQAVTQLGPDRYLIDFGEEITGQFTMEASGRAGDTIEIRCGEELEEDGLSVRFQLRCNCLYRDLWTLSGRHDRFESYDYKGFRYVEVAGGELAVDPDSFGAVVRHYPLEEDNCRFHSSDERMNAIFQICKNGVKAGAQEHYVDCPTREKGQYLGDNTVIGHSHMLLSGDFRLYRKTIGQFARSSTLCPGLMAVVPGHFMQEIADFSLQWPGQVLEYYRYSGDLDFVRDMYPHAKRLLEHFRQYDRGDGLLHEITDKWNLVDWPRELRDGYDFELAKPIGPGCHNVINAFYLGCVRSVDEMGEILGMPIESELPRLKQRFLEVFYDPALRLFRDAEGSGHHALHSNTLPLLFGLAPTESVPAVVELIRGKGFSCGVYFAYFVLRALAQAGEHALMTELLLSEEQRSWGNMVKEGATACFEAWGKDQKWNTSLCHPWASAPVPVLIENIIGLKPSKPGWKEISFAPRLPEAWKSFSLQLRVPTGWIRLSYDHGQWTEEFPDKVRVIRC
ncbi:family 78 glycoside hydrolase catalytic domain [Paenibacillus filicis]|uniref:alpha-L-rhamnosidase n=1 Tax=Paenibacillus filicis TaxID=669464 RepID=A0ABU9DSL0_9BACL